MLYYILLLEDLLLRLKLALVEPIVVTIDIVDIVVATIIIV